MNTVSSVNLLDQSSVYEALVDMLGFDPLQTVPVKQEIFHQWHYHNAQGSKVLQPIEIAQQIIKDVHAEHLIWQTGWKKWKHWYQVPVVRDLVKDLVKTKANFNTQLDHHKQVMVEEDLVHQSIETPVPMIEATVPVIEASVPVIETTVPVIETPVQAKPKSLHQIPILTRDMVHQFHIKISNDTKHTIYTDLDHQTQGLFIETDVLLAIGSQVEVIISIPKTKRVLTIRSHVQWTREYGSFTDGLANGIGIDLQILTAQTRTVLCDMLQSNTPILYCA